MAEKRQDARVRYTKMMIRGSLIALLREKPLAKVTVTELCERAGINRATFYAHYADPSDLMRSVEEELAGDVTRWIRPALTAVGSDLQEALARALGYIAENAETFSVLLSNTGDTSFQGLVMDVIEKQFIAAWASVRAISREDAAYLYTFAALGSVGIIRKWLAEGMKKSSAEIAELIVRFSDGGRTAL